MEAQAQGLGFKTPNAASNNSTMGLCRQHAYLPTQMNLEQSKKESERSTTSLCRLNKQCCNAPLQMLQNCHRRLTPLPAASEEKRLPHNTTPQDYPPRFVSTLKFRPFPKCGPEGNNLTLTNPPKCLHHPSHRVTKKILLYTTLPPKQIYLVYTPPPNTA